MSWLLLPLWGRPQDWDVRASAGISDLAGVCCGPSLASWCTGLVLLNEAFPGTPQGYPQPHPPSSVPHHCHSGSGQHPQQVSTLLVTSGPSPAPGRDTAPRFCGCSAPSLKVPLFCSPRPEIGGPRGQPPGALVPQYLMFFFPGSAGWFTERGKAGRKQEQEVQVEADTQAVCTTPGGE